jgi:hypothetical protein
MTFWTLQEKSRGKRPAAAGVVAAPEASSAAPRGQRRRSLGQNTRVRLAGTQARPRAEKGRPARAERPKCQGHFAMSTVFDSTRPKASNRTK